MISKDEAQSLIDIALKHGARRKVDGLEVIVDASDVATSRFANNGMTQNQAPQHAALSVRVQHDGRQARLTSDRLSPADIRQLVDNAIKVASFLEPDEEMLPLPKAQKKSEQKDVKRYDARTAGFCADQRAAGIRSMIAEAQKHALTAAGVFANGSVAGAIGNSNGLFRYHHETTAEISITMKRVDNKGSESTGWAKQQSPKVADLDPQSLAASAAGKAITSANPQDIQPGRYTVILEPSAVLDLLCFLDYDFTATSFVDKLSCFLDKLKKPVFGKNIVIDDDVFHPLQAGAPFDGEGMQRQAVRLAQDGKIENLVYGRSSAAKMKARPSGHAMIEPSPQGEWPQNIVIGGGNISLQQMIESTKRGILLTRVWYVREVDPTTKLVTGMTRDGTFLIENGSIKCGVKNLRFNESLLEMLNNVSALGPSLRTAGEEGEPAVVPAMKVENFHFSSGTCF